MTTKTAAASYSLEVRQRAVRLALEGRQSLDPMGAIDSVSAKIGCTAEMLRK